MALDTDTTLRKVVPIGSFGKHLSDPQLAEMVALKARCIAGVTIMWDWEVQATDDEITLPDIPLNPWKPVNDLIILALATERMMA